MREVRECPPLYEQICNRFPVKGKSVLFAWGDILYNPYGGIISPQLWAHEKLHGRRQMKMAGNDRIKVAHWWQRYLDDAGFRLAEELVAHVAEVRAFNREHADRNERARELLAIAMRMAAPMYDLGLQPAKAVAMLRHKLNNTTDCYDDAGLLDGQDGRPSVGSDKLLDRLKQSAAPKGGAPA